MTTTTTPHTTASGAADLHGMLRSAANNIAYAMDNLAGMTLAELPQGMLDSTGAAESGLLAERTIREVMGLLAASAPVAPTQPASITLDFKQATELLGMYGGEPTEVTLMVGNGHSGKGVYAHWTSVPEEGAMFLGASDDEAAPVAPAPQPAAPLTDTFVQTVPDKCDRIVWRNSYYHLPIAAPKAAPAQTPLADAAQQVVREALDAVEVHPCDVNNDSIRAKGLHGSMAALHVALAAPLQQGEYLPLPECDATTVGLGEVWNRHSMRAYVDADRAARVAAQAEGDA